MKKYQNTENGFKEIYDYGFNNYLKLNTDGRIFKLMAILYENDYALNYDKAGKIDHYELSMQIEKEFGNNYIAYIGAIGNNFDFFISAHVANPPFDIIIDILLELKQSYELTHNNIEFKILNIDEFGGKRYNSDDIDDVIGIINDIKNSKSKK